MPVSGHFHFLRPFNLKVKPVRFRRSLLVGVLMILSRLSLGLISADAQETTGQAFTGIDQDHHRIASEFIQDYCLDCHTGEDSERGFDLTDFDSVVGPQFSVDDVPEKWEKVLLRIQSRQMPPPDAALPDPESWENAQQAIDAHLDSRASRYPFAGRTEPLRRLTRTEYQNAVRDLLGLHFDVEDLLPAESSSDGFDNITVGELSPLLLDRYLTAAQKISRAAVGSSLTKPTGIIVRIQADQSQESHVDGLPFGTRGGTSFVHHFPKSGEYQIQIRLTRDRDEKIEGLTEVHEMDILLDRERQHRFEVKPPRGSRGYASVDAALKTRIQIPAGEHRIGVTFIEKSSSLREIKRAPFETSYNRHRHPRLTPAIHEISIVGPLETTSNLTSIDETESKNQILVTRPDNLEDADQAAEHVFKHLTRLAYRRTTDESDLATPMHFFREAFRTAKTQTLEHRFEAGIEAGLTSILVNPNFLFRTVEQPAGIEPGTIYPLNDFELASRMSFFLWSSGPDEPLLEVAEEGDLQQKTNLKRETLRLLADPKSSALVDSFADQWLYLRNLPTITPDLRKFPSFDNNLRLAFAEETKRLFADIIQRDASALELLSSDHTFLNERLAVHYGIPGVIGDHFRRVDLASDSHRGGILRHGSVLMVTSYATRTSPTIRGAWVLENILGTPPPPPPPNVPPIEEKSKARPLTFREALAVHRQDPTCASCHDLIDPVGFALDRYDAVGRWRQTVEGAPIDASGKLPDGQIVDGVEQLEQGILNQPDLFVTALAKKLLTYALGRPLKAEDGPAIRRIVRSAAADDYRFSTLVTGITESTPFRMRTSR